MKERGFRNEEEKKTEMERWRVAREKRNEKIKKNRKTNNSSPILEFFLKIEKKIKERERKF